MLVLALTRRYTKTSCPDVVVVRGDQHIATYVQRLVQDGLHGASVRTLGRAQLRSECRTSTIRIIFGQCAAPDGVRPSHIWELCYRASQATPS